MAPADEGLISFKHDVSSTIEQPDSTQIEIVGESYLVRRISINPETGETRGIVGWVSRNSCSAEAIAKWEANKPIIEPGYEPSIGGSLICNVRKRSISSDVNITDAPNKRRELNNESIPVTKPAFSSRGRNLHSPKGPDEQLPRSLRKSQRKPPSLFIPSTRRSSKEKSTTTNNKDTLKITAKWYLDRVISTQNDMLLVVELRGTSSGETGDGWYRGQYEGAQGVILAVLNTGDTSVAGTARVALLDVSGSSHAKDVFTIPLSHLWPVEPTGPGQSALVLYGDQKGSVAIVREEEVDGWFVSVGDWHFTIRRNQLVRVINLDEFKQRFCEVLYGVVMVE